MANIYLFKLGLSTLYIRHSMLILCCVIVILLPIHSFAMSNSEKTILRLKSKEMFFHAYNNYMQHAYPADELMPLSCRGRYRGSEPPRGDIDDILGNYSLTLIDSLDTLFLLNAEEEFEQAVRLVIKDVSFDRDVVVSVFEANIRLLGGLLGGHVAARLLQNKGKVMGWYKDELLHLAEDLGYRLLPSFNSTTGIPYPRVNLKYGIQSDRVRADEHTCTACAGTTLLEFGALSRLTGNPEFEARAKRAMDYLWEQRNRQSDLVGNVLNIHTGEWIRRESGVGAGIDSYYEYLFKAYVLLGDGAYLHRFNTHYAAIKKYIGSTTFSLLPMLVDVHMHKPSSKAKNFMDSLHAFWPALQVFSGDIEQAIALHEVLHHVVQRHQFLPEAFTTDLNIHWAHHPLRPEFIESTYFLYRATGDSYYLRIGASVLQNLETHARVPCGFAAIKDVRTMDHDDQLDSFVLAETFKYLYLLFSDSNHLPISLDDYIFTTEAHLLPVSLSSFTKRTFPNSGPLSPTYAGFINGTTKFVTDEDPLFASFSLPSGLAGCPNPRMLRSSSEETMSPLTSDDPYLSQEKSSSIIDFLLTMTSKETFATLSRFPENCLPVSQRIRTSLQHLLHRLYPNEENKQGSDIKIPAGMFPAFTPLSSATSATTPVRSFILKAENLNVQNPLHVETLKWMGIRVIIGQDGNARLHHLPNQASNEALAQEGLKFMNDVIRLQHKVNTILEKNESRYVVPITSPYYGRLQLRAGISRFSPFPDPKYPSDITAPKLSSTARLSDFGVYGSVVMHPGVGSFACDSKEEFSRHQRRLMRKAIVIVRRGGCMFVEKARNLLRVKALAGIVIDQDRPGTSMETQGGFAMSGDDQGDVPLPFIFLFTVEATQLLLIKEEAEKRPGGRLNVLLTSTNFSPDVIRHVAMHENTEEMKTKLTSSSEENSSEPKPTFSSEAVSHVQDILRPVPSQSYIFSYHLKELRALHVNPGEVSDTADSPAVTFHLKRQLMESDPSETPPSCPDGNSNWILTLHFNMASKLFYNSFSKEEKFTSDNSEESIVLLSPFVHLLQGNVNGIPTGVKDVLFHLLHQLLDVVGKEGNQLLLQEQPSVEKVLTYLESVWQGLGDNVESASNSSTHSLVIRLHQESHSCSHSHPPIPPT